MSEQITGNHKISGCHTAISGPWFNWNFLLRTFSDSRFVRGSAGVRFGQTERQVTSEETCVIPSETLVDRRFRPWLRTVWIENRGGVLC